MLVYRILAVIFIFAGVLGVFIPILPGTPLIFIGGLIYGFASHFEVITVIDLVILFIFVLIAEGLEYLFTVMGAKKFGASKAGLIGGTFGVFIGLILLGPVGILIGPLVGAIVAELMIGRSLDQAVKVGVGSLIGVLGGMVMTFIISLIMACWVIFKIF